MPELPEVETMVRGLRPQLEGRLITDVRLADCPRKPIQVSPDFHEFRRQQQGREIQNVHRLAKRVVIRLDNHRYVVIEPRMTGLMLVADPPTQTHRRMIWIMAAASTLATSFEFWDRRGLGTIRLLSDDGFSQLKNSLGTDALKMTVDDWLTIKHRTTRPVKVAMLEQKLVAGIGNLYASEILFRSEVSPKKSCRRVTRRQWQAIARHTNDVLHEAIRYEGSTLADGTYRNALNQDGSYQNAHQVYAKAGEPCPRCVSRQIQRIVQAQRATFYCPGCQK